MARGWLSRSYNFIDKDPEIDVFRTFWQKERLKESDLAVLAGLTLTTVKRMFGGDTRQPRHSTFAKMAGAMGASYGLHRDDKPNYETEIPKARAEFKIHREQLAKKHGKRKRKTNGKGK